MPQSSRETMITANRVSDNNRCPSVSDGGEKLGLRETVQRILFCTDNMDE